MNEDVSPIKSFGFSSQPCLFSGGGGEILDSGRVFVGGHHKTEQNLGGLNDGLITPNSQKSLVFAWDPMVNRFE